MSPADDSPEPADASGPGDTGDTGDTGDAGDCPGDDARACAEVLDALHAYLDAEIDDAGLASIDAHLDACRRCGLEIDTYRRLKDAVRSTGNGLDPTVLTRLRRFAAELPRGTPLR